MFFYPKKVKYTKILNFLFFINKHQYRYKNSPRSNQIHTMNLKFNISVFYHSQFEFDLLFQLSDYSQIILVKFTCEPKYISL